MWLGATGLLTLTSAWWVSALFAALVLLLDAGSLVPLLAVSVAGVLVGRGWFALVDSVRTRLRRVDLSDVAALPDSIRVLSPPLQRLVRHTRTLRRVVGDEALPYDEVMRQLYDWLTGLAELPPPDIELLERLHLDRPRMREAVLAIGEAHSPGQSLGQSLGRSLGRSSAQSSVWARATDLLERFEARLLAPELHPFR
jgi:hypothetical protein